MPLTEEQKARIQDILQDSLKSHVSKALELQPSIQYYVLALDCNIQENGEICTALNDPKSFQDTAEKYYANEDPAYLNTEIKYNSGDFNGNSARIGAIDLFPNQELEDSQCQPILNELIEQMVIFMENPNSSYHSIPKTDDFKVIVYDHDQDASVAFQAQYKLYPKPEFYLG
ncbi:BA75_00760T0 [Komagataella pastoris]|uniref:BA75_00760T0 n=1 Tax=Komagataella pastoris TaxID=4922 RepID=A0A1B2J6Q0_PICPA|nr:BA75_00760T0 [Komagataella pastoris]